MNLTTLTQNFNEGVNAHADANANMDADTYTNANAWASSIPLMKSPYRWKMQVISHSVRFQERLHARASQPCKMPLHFCCATACCKSLTQEC